MSTTALLRKSSTLLLTLFTLGCSESGPKLAPVTGTVTIGETGEPFAGGLVRFVPPRGSNLNSREAVTDSEGRFTMMFFAGKPGLEPGEYNVMFSLYLMEDGSPPPDQAGEPDPKHPSQLGAVQMVPPEYELGKAAECAVTVPDEGGTYDFTIPELKAQAEPVQTVKQLD